MPAKPILNPLAPAPAPLQHRVLPPVAPVPAVVAPNVLQEKALSVTKEIREKLVILNVAFISVVRLLGQVRDEKLYAPLGYDTIKAYAEALLGIKQTVLDMYLRVFDGFRKSHPDLLEPGATVKIADLTDANDLLWIEEELARESLPSNKKAALQGLQKKALDGTLLRDEVRAFKARGNNKIADGNRTFLSKLRQLRESGVKLAGLPDGVLDHLNAAIEILQGTVAEARKKNGKKGKKG